MIIDFGEFGSVREEFSGGEFGDERLDKRLNTIAERVYEQPTKGFPGAMGSVAATEALYRFLSNDRVTPEKILEPHFRGTVDRIVRASGAVIIHDTSTFCFVGESERQGLCDITRDKQGFYGHLALAVASDEPNQPLGVIANETFTRTRTKGRRLSRDIVDDPDRESLRWLKNVKSVEDRIGGRARPIHVMDRQADFYELFDFMHAHGYRFAIRISHDRKLARSEECKKLFEKLGIAAQVCEREVPLSPRKTPRAYLNRSGQQPARNYRLAKLAFSAAEVEVQCTYHLQGRCAASLRLNVVHVSEIDVPQELEPVDWKIVTTEPIENREQILQIVDTYRKRWLIEEYFKALKSGCAYEKRQLESKETLLNALAILIPIAYRLLLLRAIARDKPDACAEVVLSETQISVLRAVSKKLPKKVTAAVAMKAIAELGGHLKSNGRPGWQVLWRGYQKLRSLEQGWLLRERCDQS